MSTEIDLDNLLVLAKAATHGPWTSSESIGQKGHGFCAQVWKSNGDSLVYHEDISPQATADVEFIAAANPAVVEELVLRLMEAEEKWGYYQNFVKEHGADSITNLVAQRDTAIDELDQVKAERDALRSCLSEINEIRNSILGHQNVSYSEHVYPLNDALNKAGFKGESYADARKNSLTLREQIAELKAERDALKARIDGGVRVNAYLVGDTFTKSFGKTGFDEDWLCEDMSNDINLANATLILDAPEQGVK